MTPSSSPSHGPRAGRPHMPGYGVPESLDGVLPWAWALERLVPCRNYWMVTASASGRPHALPVWGVWWPDPAGFAFSCSPSSRKARNLAANPAVSVTIDDTVECVSVEGSAALVGAGAERAALIDAYVAKYAEPGGADELAAFVGEQALWLVRPECAFGIVERPEEFGPTATKWVWDS